MIDLNDLRARPDAYADAAKKKRMAVDIKKFLALDQLRKDLLVAVEDMRAKKNSVSKRVPVMKGKEKEEAIKEMKELDRNLEAKEEELTRTESGWQEMQLFLPSIPLDSVPVGKDDTENVKLRTWGEVPTFDFEPKDHIALGEALDIIDIPRGVKIAGSRSYVLKGDGARLELAVLLFTIDHLQKKGFTPFLPPLLANYEAMMGTSYFPGGEEQAYAVGVQKQKGGPMESDGLWLIGTSEVSVASTIKERPWNFPIFRSAMRASATASAARREPTARMPKDSIASINFKKWSRWFSARPIPKSARKCMRSFCRTPRKCCRR